MKVLGVRGKGEKGRLRLREWLVSMVGGLGGEG